MSGRHPTAEEQAVAACYRSWADRYFDDYYSESAPYPPVHADVILKRLLDHGTTRLLDAGCGPASFLRHIKDVPIEWHGFDLTPEMVTAARTVAASLGQPDAQVWEGSVLDDAAFEPPDRAMKFDAAVMMGVLPHVPAEEDAGVLRRLKDAVLPGGLLIAEARNALFGLYTLNRATHEFFATRLIDFELLASCATDLERAVLEGIDEALAGRFRMDLPPRRRGDDRGAGYDDVLARTHVPAELEWAARAAGWTDVELVFSHHHALPPMFEHLVPAAFRRASLALEDANDWRSTYTASTVMVVGRRPEPA